MTLNTKYDAFNQELASLEKLIYKYIQKITELTEFNTALQTKINQLDKENEILKLKIKELETAKSGLNEAQSRISELKNLSEVEKESLNKEINSLIEKINFHLHSA